MYASDVTGNPVQSGVMFSQDFRAQGSVWTPLWVGVRFSELAGALTSWDIDVHLDYEVIEIPWDEWFLRWEFLDNVVDNERQY